MSIKQLKLGDKNLYIMKYNIFTDVFRYLFMATYILGLVYLNQTYINNSWWINLFIFITGFAFSFTVSKTTECDKKEVLEFIK